MKINDNPRQFMKAREIYENKLKLCSSEYSLSQTYAFLTSAVGVVVLFVDLGSPPFARYLRCLSYLGAMLVQSWPYVGKVLEEGHLAEVRRWACPNAQQKTTYKPIYLKMETLKMYFVGSAFLRNCRHAIRMHPLDLLETLFSIPSIKNNNAQHASIFG